MDNENNTDKATLTLPNFMCDESYQDLYDRIFFEIVRRGFKKSHSESESQIPEFAEGDSIMSIPGTFPGGQMELDKAVVELEQREIPELENQKLVDYDYLFQNYSFETANFKCDSKLINEARKMLENDGIQIVNEFKKDENTTIFKLKISSPEELKKFFAVLRKLRTVTAPPQQRL